MARGVDRALVAFIAVAQVAISGLLLSMQFLIAYGGGFSVLTPLWVCGLVSAFFLRPRFSRRIVAAAWHGFVGALFLLRSGESEKALRVIGLYLLVATFYLIASALKQQKRNGTSKLYLVLSCMSDAPGL